MEACELLRGRRVWFDHRRPLQVRGSGNVVHADSFLEGYAAGELGEVLLGQQTGGAGLEEQAGG